MILQRLNLCNVIVKASKFSLRWRTLTTAVNTQPAKNEIVILNQKYPTDSWTNVSPNIIGKLGRNLHLQQYHPLSLLRQRIVNYIYTHFRNRIGNPTFSIHDNLSPVVSVEQNFDSLLVQKDHPSRQKSDCYYINQEMLLRAHTTAHQKELISMGLNNFLVIGDVYRRDEIDSTHYPVFHQADAVRLQTADELFENVTGGQDLQLFEHNGTESNAKQACHTLEAVKIMETELKNTLVGLAEAIFGADIKYQWVNQYFPFTHPSWELEVFYDNKWIEILGCGIMRQEILERSGAQNRVGWAFGLGLERLAMCLYDIPDIRLFWSTDTGFLNQFKVEDPNTDIKYKPISIYPQCAFDISFWLPKDHSFSQSDFYDIVRELGADMVEQIILKDKFTHPKTNKTSLCYSIVFRHMERTLTKKEIGVVHSQIRKAVVEKLYCEIR